MLQQLEKDGGSSYKVQEMKEGKEMCVTKKTNETGTKNI